MAGMKKVLLSLAVIGVFVFYSLHERDEASHVQVVVSSSLRSTPIPSAGTTSTSSGTPPSTTSYKDGTYVGSTEDVFYGDVQVQATITGGKITAIDFLKYPNDQANSTAVSQMMMPILQQEAIQAQSSKVDIVSGATDSSVGFMRSLTKALTQAKI